MSTLPADMSPVTEPMPRFDPAAVEPPAILSARQDRRKRRVGSGMETAYPAPRPSDRAGTHKQENVVSRRAIGCKAPPQTIATPSAAQTGAGAPYTR
jgi:hypothetical protein